MSRDDTKIIKAIAIMLVMMNHLWMFPDRLPGNGLKSLFTLFGMSAVEYISNFARFILALFFFIAGYGIYKSTKGKKYDLIDRLKKLYFAVWKVFLVFVPIGFIFFSHQGNYCLDTSICHRYEVFDISEFLANFFGILYSYNEEWWFIGPYVVCLVVFPVMKAVADKFSLRTNYAILIVGQLLVMYVFPALGDVKELGNLNSNYLYRRVFCEMPPGFFLGILAAKDDLLERIKESMKKAKITGPVWDILILIAILFLRQVDYLDDLDFFYAPIFIVVFCDLVGRVKIVKKIFVAFGDRATNIWLIHSFLCYYFYYTARVVTYTGWAVPAFITLCIMSYIAAVGLDYFWKYLGIGYEKVFSMWKGMIS